MSKLTNEQTWQLVQILQDFQENDMFDYAWETLKTFITDNGFTTQEEKGEN